MNKQKVAIFDLDGTLYEGHSVDHLLEYLAEKGLFPSVSFEKEQEIWDRYKTGQISYEDATDLIVDTIAEGLKGKSQTLVEKSAKEFFNLNKRWFPFVCELFDHFKEIGYKTILISGTLVEIIRALQSKMGEIDYYGTILEVKNDVYTGETLRYGAKAAAKKEAIEEILSTYTLDESFGFGDTESDLGFLNKVTHPFTINPTPILKKVALEKGWNILSSDEAVAEKAKSLVYEN